MMWMSFQSTYQGENMRNTGMLLLALLLLCNTVQAAQVTHGPMAGHTSHQSVSIWVRADETCAYSVQVQAAQGGMKLMSKSVTLNSKNNFCGVAHIKGLLPSTAYSYRIFLDGAEQSTPVAQRVTTYPAEGKPGIIRFAFGHGVNGNDPQPIWDAIAEKQPMFFLIMGGQHLLQQHRTGQTAFNVPADARGSPIPVLWSTGAGVCGLR
jgi:phosphodiesterase/alkaline phosphatase D-like protein